MYHIFYRNIISTTLNKLEKSLFQLPFYSVEFIKNVYKILNAESLILDNENRDLKK